jgi:hypothetical protein
LITSTIFSRVLEKNRINPIKFTNDHSTKALS